MQRERVKERVSERKRGKREREEGGGGKGQSLMEIVKANVSELNCVALASFSDGTNM